MPANGIPTRYRPVWYLLAVCILQNGIASRITYADTEPFVTKQKRFIQTLYAQRRHFDAIAETRRLMEQLGPLQRQAWEYFVSLNYFQGKQYKTVITRYARTSAAGRRFPDILLFSRACMALGLYDRSLDVLSVADCRTLAPPEQRELLLRKVEVLLGQSRYADAVDSIDAFKRCGQGDDHMTALRSDLLQYRKIGGRSRIAAALFSAALPGSGQWYAGKYVEGLVTLAGVCAPAYAAWRYNRRGEHALAYTLAFFSGLFYAGGIYGAYNAASDYTLRREREFNRQLLGRYIPSYDPAVYFDRSMLR